VTRLRDGGYKLLRLLSSPFREASRLGFAHLRILAYHDVPDIRRFDFQMSHLARHYEVVGGPAFTRSIVRKPPVWITFDDGDPSVVDTALDVLSRYGFSATAFICPGVIDTVEPYWWQIVTEAYQSGVTVGGSRVDGDEVSRLKSVPDDHRRRRVAEVREAVRRQNGELIRRQLTRDDLDSWLSAGHSIGNHSWDHPILDQCTTDEQRRQVVDAHHWFVNKGYPAPRWFAYPNGNSFDGAERLLADLGYEAALLFDHRLASRSQRMTLSRIRVNATDSLDEFSSKVSGIHPTTMRWRRR
jgi:peptidoglycan/xylan/chitin deacetylase (PgdA/CDA1 family)